MRASGVEVQICKMTVEFPRRRKKLVARAELQREIGTRTPIVARVAGSAPTAKIVARSPEACISAVGKAEEKIAKIEPGDEAAEGEQALRSWIRRGVVFDAAHFRPEGQRVLRKHIGDCIHETIGLIPHQ